MKFSPATGDRDNCSWRIVKTGDGSDTLFSERYHQHYHSLFGALTESNHIFIDAAFREFVEKRSGVFPSDGYISVLEIGFGTGLNALLTLAESGRRNISVRYTALEPEPVHEYIWRRLNYPQIMGSADYFSLFAKLHLSGRGSSEPVTDLFQLQVLPIGLETFRPSPGSYHIIYFDAFDSVAQPELWYEDHFKILYDSIQPAGLLTTYSVKGTVVRALRAAGFTVARLPGPPGKRHILRATKSWPQDSVINGI